MYTNSMNNLEQIREEYERVSGSDFQRSPLESEQPIPMIQIIFGIACVIIPLCLVISIMIYLHGGF